MLPSADYSPVWGLWVSVSMGNFVAGLKKVAEKDLVNRFSRFYIVNGGQDTTYRIVVQGTLPSDVSPGIHDVA